VSVPAALAALQTPDGLTACLDVNQIPAATVLALDYASYEGTPALLVVTPAAVPDQLDVWVLGGGCGASDPGVVTYLRVPKP
jgi:hypothetical protein